MDNSILLENKYKIDKTFLGKLGKGSFGKVYVGKIIESGQNVAIKVMSLVGKKNKAMLPLSNVKFEIKMMKKLDHVNIVKYIDHIKTLKKCYIIMEYCNAGTLKDIINYNQKMARKIGFNREGNTHYYLYQLKNALAYIRNLGYVHRDIKPINILLSSSFDPNNYHTKGNLETIYKNRQVIVKLADFGLAKNCEDNEQKLMHTRCGSPLYMAPEQFVSDGYSSKTDLWAYGTIMYEMIYGVHFNKTANTYEEIFHNLESTDINFNLQKNFTPECFDLLTKLLNKSPLNRISWTDFFNHSWFSLWQNQDLDMSIVRSNNNNNDNNKLVNLNLTNNNNNRPISNRPLSNRLISNPIKINYHLKEQHAQNSYPSNFSISPLGYSNLSKMKVNDFYQYPSSYPLNNQVIEKKRNFFKSRRLSKLDSTNNNTTTATTSSINNTTTTINDADASSSSINNDDTLVYYFDRVYCRDSSDNTYPFELDSPVNNANNQFPTAQQYFFNNND